MTGPPSPTKLAGVSNVRNVLANWGSFLVTATAGLFVSPFVVHQLGTSAYGVWVIIGSLTGSMTILDLGVRSAVTRFVAREHARGAHDSAGRIVSTAQLMFLAAGVLAILIAGGLSLGVTNWFTIPAELHATARLVLLVSGFSIAIILNISLFGGILVGVQRLDIIGFSEIVMELVRVALVLIILSRGGGILGLALIGLFLAFSRYSYQRYAARGAYPELRLAFRRPRGADVRAILDVSIFSTLIYVSGSVIAQASTLVVGAMLPISMVTFFAIGGTLPLYARALNRPIAQTVHPRASRHDALNDAVGLQALILNTGRYSTLVVLPLAATFIFRGHTFIGIWMGEEFKALSGYVLLVLSIGLVFSVSRHVMQAAFVGSGRHRHLAPSHISEAVLVALLSVLFVWRWGVQGAAWAVVIPGLVMCLVVFPWLSWRHFGVKPGRLWWDHWVWPILAMLPFATASLVVDRALPTSTYLGFFGQVFMIFPIAVAGAFFLGLSGKERGAGLKMAGAYLRRIRGEPETEHEVDG